MDNLNISFAPDKSAEDKGRINAVEDYLSLLTERIKFCFNGIDENIAQKSDGEEEKQLIYSTIADEVGQFTNTDRNCEVFNDYKTMLHQRTILMPKGIRLRQAHRTAMRKGATL